MCIADVCGASGYMLGFRVNLMLHNRKRELTVGVSIWWSLKTGKDSFGVESGHIVTALRIFQLNCLSSEKIKKAVKWKHSGVNHHHTEGVQILLP